MSNKHTPPPLSTPTIFVAYEDDDYNKDKSDKKHASYDPANNDGGLNEKKSLDKRYNQGHKSGDQNQDYGSLQVGPGAWLMAYDGPNFSGSLRLFHNVNADDLDDYDGSEYVNQNGNMTTNNKWDNSIASWRLAGYKHL